MYMKTILLFIYLYTSVYSSLDLQIPWNWQIISMHIRKDWGTFDKTVLGYWIYTEISYLKGCNLISL